MGAPKLTNDVSEIIRLYSVEKKTIVEIAEQYNVVPSTIHRRLIKNNIPIHCKSVIRQKYTLDVNYFENIDSEDKAYFLGLIYADGCLSGTHYALKIALQEEDNYILEILKDKLKYTGKITTIDYSSRNCKNQKCLTIYNMFLYQHLLNIGLTPNKTLTTTFPIIRKDLIPHFIRGYFDGDGSIFNTPNNQRYLSFCGSYSFINSIKNEIIKYVDLNDVKILQGHKNKAFYYRVGGNKQIKKIYEYLYKNSTIYLKRKKNKFDELYNN